MRNPGDGGTEHVREQVEAAARFYDLGRPLEPARRAARGQMGVIWLLVTDRGRFAVKQLLTRLDEDAVATEVGFQVEMARRGVPLPTPLRRADGRVLTEVNGLLLRAFTWVDVEEPRTDLDPVAVGGLLATLHRDPLPADPPVHPWYVDPVAAATWEELGEALNAARAPFAADFALFARHQLSMQEFFGSPGHLQLCHRDLWADNLRTTTDGSLCVIDWDNCGAADPAQEVAMVLTELCYAQPERAGTLYSAYLDGGGTGRVKSRQDFTMAQAQFGHFATTAAQRWLGTTDQEARDRAEAWFRLGLEVPMDALHVDELLTAVRG